MCTLNLGQCNKCAIGVITVLEENGMCKYHNTPKLDKKRARKNGRSKQKTWEIRKCKICNNDFYTPYYYNNKRNYCSNMCARIDGVGRGKSKTGITKQCKKCGKDFYVLKSQINTKIYCSTKCYNETRANPNRKNKKLMNEYRKNFYKNHYEKYPEKKIRQIELAREKRRKKRDEIDAEIAKKHPLLVSAKKRNGGRGKIKRGKIKKCKWCKSDFYCRPSMANQIYCNEDCYNEDQRKNSKRICVICNNVFYCSASQLKHRHRKTCSVKCRGLLSQKIAEERRLKNPPTPAKLNRQLRYSTKANNWRKAVFERDDYTCQKCGARNGNGKTVYLQAHHKKSWAEYPEFRFDISNGQTLCRVCHKKEDHPTRFKERTPKELIKELDMWCSLFIRLRYADENGMVKCFTSGKTMHYKQSQAGRFISKEYLATRWDDKNVQVQSVHENIYHQGNTPVFATRLAEKYGRDIIATLSIQKHGEFNTSKEALKLLIEDYKRKIKKIIREKNIVLDKRFYNM